jgi:phytanoyl-CoA hydroxylase
MKKSDQPVYFFGEMLSEEHILYFRKNGFIHFKNFINKETVREFLKELSEIEKHLLNNRIDQVNGIPLKFGLETNGSTILQRIAFTSHFSETLNKFLNDSRFNELLKLLAPFEGRVGGNEKDGLVFNHYLNTETSNFSRLGWHTDSPRDLFLGLSRILPMLNVGLHLDDCPADNGGLRILPGTHTQNIFRLLFRKKYFIDNKPDKHEVGLDIEAGDLTVHDGRLWHRVQRSPFIGNKSRRRVMYIPFVTGEYKPKHKDSKTPIYHKLAQIILNKHKIKPEPAKLHELEPQLDEAVA